MRLESFQALDVYLRAHACFEGEDLSFSQPPGRIPTSGLQHCYGVDYRALRGSYFLDPPGGLGSRCPGVSKKTGDPNGSGLEHLGSHKCPRHLLETPSLTSFAGR